MNRPTEPPTAHRLPPPRFSLATLMVVVTVCAIISALVVSFGPRSAIWIVFLALSVFAHIFGNALGTSLRALGSRAPLESPSAEFKVRPDELAPRHYAPATELRQKTSLGWPIAVITLAGAIVGGIGGYFGFAYFYGAEITGINLAFGAAAAAIIAGFGTFASASMVSVFWSAWKQATQDP